MKNDPIETALARLDDAGADTKEFKKALAGKSNLVAAKAARLIAANHLRELNADLAAAFNRFLTKTPDKACAATTAIARALVQLDYDDADLFLKGMRHIQMEGSYGPPIDVAADLRGICAIGLANSTYPWKLRELTPLLVDSTAPARIGVIRAIAAIGSEPAALLLRLKTLTGDGEPDVMSECFTAIISVEAAEGVRFVTQRVATLTEEDREAALLALGASRRPDAVDWLIQTYNETVTTDLRKSIVLALSTSRTEPAIEFLLDLVRTANKSAAAAAAEALKLHTHDTQLQTRLEQAQNDRV